jgi:uncharacterized protein (DUF488 family)
METETTIIWTIGHSTRSLEAFLGILGSNGIGALADVRRFPGSRRYPHYNQAPLCKVLSESGLEYLHFPELGGRRATRPDSPNTAWRNESFRGYADYMATDTFRAGLDRLLQLAGTRPTAIMCAEALWWQCHRGLIADYLKVLGSTVRHILSETRTELHPFTRAARIVDGKLSYSATLPPLEFKLE